jgi:hypothetical protein
MANGHLNPITLAANREVAIVGDVQGLMLKLELNGKP